MRLLFIHSDHLEFEAREAVSDDLAEREGVPLGSVAGLVGCCLLSGYTYLEK